MHVCDVDPAAVAAAGPRGSRATEVDVADLAALDRWIDGALEGLGGLDVLVNNAGIAGPTALVEDVGGRGVGALPRRRPDEPLPDVRARDPGDEGRAGGSIINISSTAGQYGMGMRAPYAAAKWAVIGLTKSLAIELGPYGVRANAICPGSVDGDRMRGVIQREAAARGSSSEDVEREYVEGQSIARFVQAGEIADMCLFLASDAARMVSGQAIAVDGHTETFHI